MQKPARQQGLNDQRHHTTEAPPEDPTTRFTVTDQLGSPRVILDSAGDVVSRRDFLPFGEEIARDGTYRKTDHKYGEADRVRQKFTGYQNDAETGLDFAEARMYENRHGRFTAVDPLLASGKSADPQTFNRYVYVMNNPLVLTDPSGLQAGNPSDNLDGNWWSKLKDGFNQFVRAIIGDRGLNDSEEDEFQERKRGGPDKQVGNGIRNYAAGLNQINDVISENDPTSSYNAIRAGNDALLGRGSEEDAWWALGEAAVNTALTVAPGGSSRKLASNLIGAGIKRPLNAHAHHIVAHGDARAAQARAILQKAGIGIDDAANGVFLPATKKVAETTGGLAHAAIHSNRYYEALTSRLLGTNNVKKELKRIRKEILSGTFP